MMKELMIIALNGVHLAASVLWIGGIAFILLIAIPSAKSIPEAGPGRIMGEIGKRFTPLADICIFLVIATGALLLLTGERSWIEWTFSRWTVALVSKHILALAMVCVHYYRRLILTPRIMKTADGPGKASLQKLSVNLVWVNLWLGLTVLLLSGALAAWSGAWT